MFKCYFCPKVLSSKVSCSVCAGDLDGFGGVDFCFELSAKCFKKPFVSALEQVSGTDKSGIIVSIFCTSPRQFNATNVNSTPIIVVVYV